MISFHYTYKGQICQSHMIEHFTDNGHDRYRVTLEDDLVVIAPSGLTRKNGKLIWLQSNKAGETIHPFDLIQAMGEGLEQWLTFESDI